MSSNLDEQERIVVQKTWIDAVNKAGSTTNLGVAALDLLFTRNPDFVQVFQRLKNIPPSELRGHVAFKAQGAKIANALQGVIENLACPDTEVFLYKKLEAAHVPRNLQAGHYDAFQQTLLVLLEQTLGSCTFTPFVKASWNKALTGVMDGIVGK